MKPFSILLLFLSLAVLAGCCGSTSKKEVAIDRKDPDAKLTIEEHEDGTITRNFKFDRYAWENLALRDSPSIPPDPFAAPPAEFSGEKWPARKVLAALDVPFPEDSEADASYDMQTETLTIRHEPEWVDFVEVVVKDRRAPERVINVHFEIYEVPKALALRLEQSAGQHGNHGPEWDALQKIVDDGEANFVTSATIRCRSGERSSYFDGVEHAAFSGFVWDKTVDPPAPRPDIEMRVAGTTIELDPVLGPDDVTIDFNLLIEHHTAPPASAPLEVPVPGKDEPIVIDSPVFHAKSLNTQITMRDGTTRLLCSWRPTGLPEFEDREVMRIVFMRADVVNIYGDSE